MQKLQQEIYGFAAVVDIMITDLAVTVFLWLLKKEIQTCLTLQTSLRGCFVQLQKLKK